jgi:transposase
MPRRRLSLRTIREVLRLKWECGLSDRDIAASCHIGATAVRGYVYRAKQAGLTWPLPDTLQDAQLEPLLFPPPQKIAATDRPTPNWPEVHKQLKRKGVTLQLLWEEYRRDHPHGYGYSRCCELYAAWEKTVDPIMIQEHKAGDKLFVDYAGQTMPLTDPKTGEITQAQIFVASLGASNYTYAEATLTQSSPDWIGSQVRCLAFLGGVPRLIVPDNLKSGVTSPCRYEPDVNPTYLKFAEHYGVAIVPARVRKPRDKAKVENAVLQVERRLLAPLRNHTFHSLAELNLALTPLLKAHNDQDTKSLGSSRTMLFETLDRPALRPLPAHPFGEGEWSQARVNLDYHVVVAAHRYSVPSTQIGARVEVYLTQTTVEIFVGHERIAAHKRSSVRNGFTTLTEHLAPQHKQAQWREKQFLAQAKKHGPHTERLVADVLASRSIPEQAYRSCLGLLRLGQKYGSQRLEDAAQRAHESGIPTYKSVAALLKSGWERADLPALTPQKPPLIHENLRGADYYRPQPANSVEGTSLGEEEDAHA